MPLTESDLLKKRQAAKAAGYSDQEIQQFETQLRSSGQVQPDVQQAEQSGSGGNIIGNIARGLVKPFVDTGKSAADAVVGAEMYLTDPVYRKSVNLKPGEGLSEQDAKYLDNLLNDKNGGGNEKLFIGGADTKNRADLIKDTVREAAGVGSYAVPGSIGAQGLKGAVIAGATSGGLSGLSQSKLDDWKDTAVDVGSGALIGAGTNAALYGISKGLNAGKEGRQAKAVDKEFNKLTDHYAKLANEGDPAAQETLNTLLEAKNKASPILADKYQAPSLAEKTYMSQFTIPTKRAKALKPQDTVKAMMKYGIGGNLDEIGNKAATVTGSEGFVTKLQRDAIGDVPVELDIGNAMNSTRNSLDKIIDLSPNEDSRIVANIRKMLPEGSAPNTANSLDVFDSIKELENLGHQYLNTSTYLTGNIKNEQIGRAYLDVASELSDILEKNVGKANIQGKLTPEIIAQANAVSPEFARELAGVKSLSELRRIQAPFVRIQQMIDLTNEAGMSSAQNLAQELKGVGKMVPSVTDPLAPLKPVLSSPGVNTRIAGAVDKVTGAVDATGNAIGSTANAIGNIPNQISKATGGFIPNDIISRTAVPVTVQNSLGGSETPQNSGQVLGSETQPIIPTAQTSANVPAGWDPETYANFKAANPTLEPDAEDTRMMLGEPPTSQNTLVGQDTGVDADILNKLIISDILETGGKNTEKLKQLGELGVFGAGGKKQDLTSDQKTKLIGLDQAGNAIKQLEESLNRLNLSDVAPLARIGGATAGAAGAAGFNVNASDYESLRKAVVPMIAKLFGNTSQLSDTDLRRAEDALPKITDSKTEANRKIERLKTLLEQNKQSVKSVPDTVSADMLNGIITGAQ